VLPLPANLHVAPRSLCRWGLVAPLDVQLAPPCGEIGVLCAADALHAPLHQEFIAALRTP
jgi:hypothetical protein